MIIIALIVTEFVIPIESPRHLPLWPRGRVSNSALHVNRFLQFLLEGFSVPLGSMATPKAGPFGKGAALQIKRETPKAHTGRPSLCPCLQSTDQELFP